MAIYHFAMQNISANKGKTAIASASYRSGQELYSEKEGRRYLYKRSVKPETFILVPENAPEWASDRNRLWNEVEAVETSKNSRYAKEINLALPIELSEDEQKEMLLKYCKENFSDKGMVADIAIHRDHDDNPHAHIMLTNRPFNEDGSWGVKSTKVYINDENGNPIILPSGYRKSRKEYTTNWDNKETLNSWRKNWAIAINQSLKLKGIDEEVSHLSYDEQGIDKVATRHEGYGKKGQENKEYNDEVKELNKLKDKLKTKEIELKTNHEFNLLTKEFTEKESERIKELSKSLKTYIDIENIADKKRMINNWKTSVIGKEFLGQEQVENLKIIGNQEKAIDEADKIILNASKRLINKYYPYLETDKMMDVELKNIAQVTIDNKEPLSRDEIEDKIKDFRPDLLEKEVIEISKRPYISYLNLKEQERNTLERLTGILNKHGRTIENMAKVDDIKSFYGKDFSYIQNLTKDLTRFKLVEKTIHKFYDNYFDKVFPNNETSQLDITEKDKIYRLISYVNPDYRELSLSEINDWVDKLPTQFTHEERLEGLEVLEGRSFKSLVKNPNLKRVLSDYSLQVIFLEECKDDKGISKDRIDKIANNINDERRQTVEEKKELSSEYKNIVYKPDSLSNRISRFIETSLFSLFSSDQIEIERKKRQSKLKQLQKNQQKQGSRYR